jgi:hypothetical protein
VLYIVAILIILTWMTPATPASAAGLEGHLPIWEEGFGWSYFVDHDVDYDVGDSIHINHVSENWTRTLYKILDVEGERVYKVWEQRRGTLRGTLTYGLTLPVTATAFGSGWTHIRASDMALINQTFNLTFTGDLPFPLSGKFTGGFDNVTTFEPPMPMLHFPIPSTKWDVTSTINISTEFFILAPIQDKTWYNSSEVWDLDVTATGPSPMTVTAGTYDTFTVHEVGTRTNSTGNWPVDRKWYYADRAVNVLKSFEGHELVWTDAVYTPPNQPPVGPAGTVELTTEEDEALEIDLSMYFSDPDGDVLTYGLELSADSEPNASMVRANHIWTLTPNANWSGELDLIATATDTFIQSAEGSIHVTVTAVNDPPNVIWQPYDLATEEDVPLWAAHDVADAFADVDGDALTLSANTTHGVTVFMNGTTIDLLPDPDWTGKVTITLVAEDPSGDEANTSFELLVGEVNDPPVITGSGGPVRIHETEEGVFWVEASDKDSEDLEFTWSVNGLTANGIDGPSFTYAPGDLTVSSVTIGVTVEDNWKAQATLSWDVTIMDSPWIMSSGPSSPVTALVGDTVTFTIVVQDVDTPDPTIQWTWNEALVGSGEQLPMMFGTRDVGDGVLRVEVSDGIGNDSVQWAVTVAVPNQPPTVSIGHPLDGAEVVIGEDVQLEALVDDEDVDVLTVQWSVDGTLIGNESDIKYTTVTTGTQEFLVIVSDGEFTATDSITIVVIPKTPTDLPEETSSFNLWIPLVMITLIIIAMVVVYVRTRPDRQG